jgi:hypothetical protein
MRLQKLLKSIVMTVAICALAGLAVAAVGGGPYKLAYRMQKGKSLKYMINAQTDQSREMQGQEMTFTTEGASLIHLDIEEVTQDGNVTFVYAIDSLRAHLNIPQMDTTFRNPEGLVGKRTRQVINAQGKKLKSIVVDSVKLSGMLAQMGGGRQASVTLIELPVNEVKVGDSWTTSNTDTMMQGGGKIIVTPNNTYTVVGEVDTLGYKCVRISYQGKATIKGEGTQMGMNFFIEGEGPTTGTAYFAPKDGLLVALVSNSDIEMTIALTGQMSMTIPQSSSTKISMVLVK